MERTGAGPCSTQPQPEAAPESEDLSLSQTELIERIRWLMNLRWLAFAGVAATILIVRTVFESSLPWGRLFLAALAIPAYNLVFLVYWRHAARAGARRLKAVAAPTANLQILCDLLVLGALLHLSGGIENPFGFYFVFHMVIAGFLLSRRAAFAQATAATAIAVGVAAAEYYQLLPHYKSSVGFSVPGVLHANPLAVLAYGWVMATALLVTAYLATSIACRLRQREDEVTALSRRIAEHARDLEKTCDRLAAIERAKTEYTRNVAHDLRSPLAAIDVLLRSVVEGLHGEVSEEARATIEQARHRGRGLLSLVRDLLSLAAATQAKVLSDWGNVSIPALAEQVISRIAPEAENRGITIRNEVGREIPEVYGDRKGIEEMLSNLIDNAVKYSRDGGEVRVRIYLRRRGAQIEVSDTGIGIDEADREKVFEQFYRAGNAREFTHEGTGLGLSIVKNIVEAHSGTIDVESTPGEGSRFTVWLPGAARPAP